MFNVHYLIPKYKFCCVENQEVFQLFKRIQDFNFKSSHTTTIVVRASDSATTERVVAISYENYRIDI